MKDFDKWNEHKKIIESHAGKRFIHEREVWWCSLGLNIGDEEDGKNDLYERPVLILRKFNDHLVLVVPLTTQLKNNEYYLSLVGSPVQEAAVLSQLRLISTKRLNRKARKVSPERFEKVIDRIIEVVFKKPRPAP